eukprot:12797256-Alexandrium_andersonii.AAC.1
MVHVREPSSPRQPGLVQSLWVGTDWAEQVGLTDQQAAACREPGGILFEVQHCRFARRLPRLA